MFFKELEIPTQDFAVSVGQMAAELRDDEFDYRVEFCREVGWG
jgi:hypothetical protein